MERAIQRSAKRKIHRAERRTTNIFAVFSKEQTKELKEAFNLIDQNQDGIVDKQDLFNMYTSLGVTPKDKQLEEMINMAPKAINFTLYVTLFAEKLQGTDPEDVLLNAFACFDEKDKGSIPKDYLKECLMTMGERWSEDQVEEFFHYAPRSNGRFNYRDFARIMKRGDHDSESEADHLGQGQ